MRLRAAREEKRAQRALARSTVAGADEETHVSPAWFVADLDARLEAIADRLDALSSTAFTTGTELHVAESNVRPIVTRLWPALEPSYEPPAHLEPFASTG